MEFIWEFLWEGFWLVFPLLMGYLIHQFQHRFKSNYYKRMMRFKVSSKENSHLRFYTANPGLWDEQELVTYGYVFEYQAAGELGSTLSRLYGSQYKISTHMSIKDFDNYKRDDLDEDLVVIGGPFHNSIAREFLNRMGDSFPFHFEEDATLVYTDPHDPFHVERFSPRVVRNNHFGEDYALVMNVKNPYDPEKRVIFIIGCRSIGCLGGAIFMSKQLKELKGKVTSDEYAAVVFCCGDQENLTSYPKLVGHYPLEIRYN